MNALKILTLQQLKGVGRKTIKRLIEAAGGTDFADSEIDSASLLHDELVRVEEQVSRFKAPDIETLQSAFGESSRAIEDARNKNIQVVGLCDEGYPEMLRQIPDPPVLLFARGDLSAINRKEAVAIIGTRKPTEYGTKAARRLGVILAEREIAVVSGLAYGCDIAAHRGCIEKTGIGIAVLAHGLDMIYPAAHATEAEQLVESGGVLVTEYPPEFKPNRRSFVERDRLQSGLSRGVFVVETGEKGGTMHTVGFAKKQGRKVACISYHPERYRSYDSIQGNLRLLKSGAASPVGSPEDIDQFLSDINIGGPVEPTHAGVPQLKKSSLNGRQPTVESQVAELEAMHSLSEPQSRMVKKLLTQGSIQRSSLTYHTGRTADALKRRKVVDEKDGVITLLKEPLDYAGKDSTENGRATEARQLELL